MALPVEPERALAGRAGLAGRSGPDRPRCSSRLRGLRTDARSLEEFATTPPFRELARTETEFVAGPRAAFAQDRVRLPRGASPGRLPALDRDPRARAHTACAPALPALLAGRGAVLGADQAPLAEGDRRAGTSVTAAVLLIAVTAVWGVTFVQVKDAVAIYPLFAFLAVRYAIATAVLAPVALPRLRGLGRDGLVAGVVLGGLLAVGSALQTAGLERTTVTNTGFITGLYVLLTPLFALVLFRTRITRELWAGGRARPRRPRAARGRSERLGGRRPARAPQHRRAGAADRDGRALREPPRRRRPDVRRDGGSARRFRRDRRSRSAISRSRTGRPSGRR